MTRLDLPILENIFGCILFSCFMLDRRAVIGGYHENGYDVKGPQAYRMKISVTLSLEILNPTTRRM